MIDYRRLAIALVRLTVLVFLVFAVAIATAAIDHHAYLPFVHGAAVRTTGQVFPPNGLHCLLQQGTSRVVDPRTDAEDFSCEASDNHGQIVWSGNKLLMDHVAVGSGSLSVTDGVVYITAVNSNGSIQIERVP